MWVDLKDVFLMDVRASRRVLESADGNFYLYFSGQREEQPYPVSEFKDVLIAAGYTSAPAVEKELAGMVDWTLTNPPIGGV